MDLIRFNCRVHCKLLIHEYMIMFIKKGLIRAVVEVRMPKDLDTPDSQIIFSIHCIQSMQPLSVSLFK